ncbi:MAG: FtsX-like permease family protein [Spirochaetia bacterium]|jgi:putative ABC transport system permease protein|nr:FtsX-like permease family protein [Spirochaetales bacterium]MDX9783270.1 FtsX-like permease family protein [Spirochaetia bacterium]
MTKTLLSIAMRNVVRHWRRSLISAIVLTVGIGMFIFFDSVLAGMDRMTIDSMVQFNDGSLKVMTEEYFDNKRTMPLKYGIAQVEELVAGMESTFAESSATPRTPFMAFASNRIDSLPALGYAIDPVTDPKVFKLQDHIDSGTWFSGHPDGGEILIGKILARDLGLKQGDWLLLSARMTDESLNADEYKIAGILDIPDMSLNESGIFMTFAEARKLLGDDLPVSTVAVSLPRPANLTKELSDSVTAAALVEKKYNGLKAVSIAEAANDYMAMRDMKSKYSMLIILIVLLIAGVGIVNTILMSVYSRIKEIGVLRAYGMMPIHIRRLFSIEGLLIGFIGSSAALVLGSLLVWWSVRWGIPIGDFFGGLDMGVIPISDGLRGEWHPGTMAFGFLFGVIASWISARIPAAKAGKLEVTEALRFV